MEQAPVRWFVPEAITHLYYSPVYRTLAPQQKLFYNKLHACYMCEMCVFFEETLPFYYSRAAHGPRVPEPVQQQGRELVKCEGKHAAMFRALARHLSPELYGDFKYHFIRLPPAVHAVIRVLFSRPALFPVLFWIILLQEERVVFYGNEILRQAAGLDPEVVEAHRRHIGDEAAHLGVDEALLDVYWDRNHPWVRRLNGRLFRFIMSEFLNTPKRGGIRLIERWVKECPELRDRQAELTHEILKLARNPQFHESLYSRRIVPRTFALFDRYEEFRDLGRSLWGYSPEVSG